MVLIHTHQTEPPREGHGEGFLGRGVLISLQSVSVFIHPPWPRGRGGALAVVRKGVSLRYAAGAGEKVSPAAPELAGARGTSRRPVGQEGSG
jgi:hypothetical protein